MSNQRPTEPDVSSGHPYALAGFIVVASAAAAIVSSWFGFVVIAPSSVENALFGLALMQVVLALGVAYVLFTLPSTLAGGRGRKPYYDHAGAALGVVTSGLVVLSWFGDGWVAVPAVPRAFLALGAAGLVLAAGTAYILFTLHSSLHLDRPRSHDHKTAGVVVVVGLLAAVGFALTPVAGLGPWRVSGMPFALATVNGVTGLALVLVLRTLGDSVAERRFQRHERAARGLLAAAEPAAGTPVLVDHGGPERAWRAAAARTVARAARLARRDGVRGRRARPTRGRGLPAFGRGRADPAGPERGTMPDGPLDVEGPRSR